MILIFSFAVAGWILNSNLRISFSCRWIWVVDSAAQAYQALLCKLMVDIDFSSAFLHFSCQCLLDIELQISIYNCWSALHNCLSLAFSFAFLASLTGLLAGVILVTCLFSFWNCGCYSLAILIESWNVFTREEFRAIHVCLSLGYGLGVKIADVIHLPS